MKSGVFAGHPLRWNPRLTTSMVISSLKSHLREHLNDLNMLLSFALLICNLIALRSENVFWMMAILKTWWQNRTKQTNPLLMINQPSFRSTWNNACVFCGVLTAVSSWGSTRLGPIGEGVEFSQTCLSEDWRLRLPPPASGVTHEVLASCTSGLLRVECWVRSCWHPTSSASEKPGGRTWGELGRRGETAVSWEGTCLFLRPLLAPQGAHGSEWHARHLVQFAPNALSAPSACFPCAHLLVHYLTSYVENPVHCYFSLPSFLCKLSGF